MLPLLKVVKVSNVFKRKPIWMLVKKILNEHGIVSDDDYAIDINQKINQFSMNFLDEY